MTEEKTKFPDTVFLIDVEYLNAVNSDLKKHFTGVLGRELPDMELDKLITYLALDADIPAGEKEIMVILIHNSQTKRVFNCIPSDINKELQNVAFRNNLGEFQFTSLSTEGLTTHEELFLNILEVITDSPDTKKIVFIPFEGNNDSKFKEIIKEKGGKEFVQFGMKKPDIQPRHKWDFLAFPLMQAFGIRGDEIN